jgi:hypothetical protein
VKTTPGANDKWNKSKTEANNRPGGKYEPHMRIRQRERGEQSSEQSPKVFTRQLLQIVAIHPQMKIYYTHNSEM